MQTLIYWSQAHEVNEVLLYLFLPMCLKIQLYFQPIMKTDCVTNGTGSQNGHINDCYVNYIQEGTKLCGLWQWFES